MKKAIKVVGIAFVAVAVVIVAIFCAIDEEMTNMI